MTPFYFGDGETKAIRRTRFGAGKNRQNAGGGDLLPLRIGIPVRASYTSPLGTLAGGARVDVLKFDYRGTGD